MPNPAIENLVTETKTETEKLQKVLARAGFGSRREIETWIEEGRVKVNGKPATLGDRVDDNARIEVDGKRVHPRQLEEKRCRVLIYHKPAGKMCTRSDPEGRPTIYEDLPRVSGVRFVPVGRLDLNTSGLLLVTTDGELANRLMHPSHEVEREYAVRVLGEVDRDTLTRLQEGVELEDGPAHFDAIINAGGDGANHWYHVILREGRNREVRRLWESQGLTVSRLTRVRFGEIALPRGLKQGRWEDLPEEAVDHLRKSVGLSASKPVPRRGAKSVPSRGGKPAKSAKSRGHYAGRR